MHSTAIGLRSAFRSITSRPLLRELFSRLAPSADIDWKAKDLPETLHETCAKLRENARNEYADIICALQEICDVSADRKSPERLVREIRDKELIERFARVIESEGRHLQNCAVWLLLNAPKVWSRLTISAKALSIQARTFEEYEATPKTTPDNTRLPLLRGAISAHLAKETLHGDLVHIELDEEGDVFRYFVSVNSFPANVQQFDESGKYAVARDANAINFLFEYLPHTGAIRIKCPLSAPIRRELVRLFAEIILDATVKSKARILYDLSHHLKGRVLPLPNHPHITGVRICAVSVSFRNKVGNLDTLSVGTPGPTELNRRLLDCLAACNIRPEQAMVEKVEYQITIRKPNRLPKTYTAHVKPDGFHYICRETETREIIRNYLTLTVS